MSQTHVLLSQCPGPLMPNTPKDKVSNSVTALRFVVRLPNCSLDLLTPAKR